MYETKEENNRENPTDILLDNRTSGSGPSETPSYGAMTDLRDYIRTIDTTYISLERQEYQGNTQGRINFGWKLHISVKEESANVDRAWKIVLDIASKYRICSLKCKVAGALSIENNGKPICIYLIGNEELAKKKCGEVRVHAMIREIETELQSANILPGAHSIGDAPIKGSAYCFYRNEAGEELEIEDGKPFYIYCHVEKAKEIAKEKGSEQFNPYNYEDNFDLGNLNLTARKNCCALM